MRVEKKHPTVHQWDEHTNTNRYNEPRFAKLEFVNRNSLHQINFLNLKRQIYIKYEGKIKIKNSILQVSLYSYFVNMV